MTRFDLYVGKILYLSTYCADEAFKAYRKWATAGAEVGMKFVRAGEAA
jgi:hypothetical protein